MGKILALPGPKFAHPFMMKLFKRGTVKSAHGHGIGRHSEEEVKKMGLADLKAFSEYLGNKPFLFGEKPSIADASLFGFLAEILSTHDEDNWLRKAIEDDFKVQSMSPISILVVQRISLNGAIQKLNQ